MSSLTRYDYRLYCKTESVWVSGTTSAPPTCCFNNNSHVIDLPSITLVRTISPQVVTLAEEDTATGGNYKCDGISFTALANTITTYNFNYPFPINLLSATSNLPVGHLGNSVDVYFVPDSVIGGTTQLDGPVSDRTLAVTALALPNFVKGLSVSITDPQGSENLGVVVSTDTNTNTVVISGDPLRPYTVGSTLTVSYSSRSGVLTADAVIAFPLIISVASGDAAAAVVGVLVTLAGQPAGSVTAISGNMLTLSGSISSTVPAGSAYTLSVPNFQTVTTDDTLPTNVLEVQDTCIQYGVVGMAIRITDGVHLDNLGRIIAIDKATKRITVEFPPTRAYGAGSYVMVTRYFIQNLEFGGGGSYGFSSGRNKGVYIPEGKTGRFAYTNRTNADIRFNMRLEYLH